MTRAFKDDIAFSHTGLAPVKGKKNTLKNQLQNFRFSLMRYGAEIEKDPSSWLEAFYMLEKFLEKNDNGQKQVVFIDELSWMDTPRSFFTTALESFWNGWGNRRNNLVLVICSSATSWMLDNVINEGGGLYNRLTKQIHLEDVCFNYIPQIKDALGIAGIITEEGTLFIKNDEKAKLEELQLDMLIWQTDNVVNLCEMKYTKELYTIDEKYSEKLTSRAEKFSERYKKYIPHITLISPKGIKFNKYSSAVQSTVSLSELFK